MYKNPLRLSRLIFTRVSVLILTVCWCATLGRGQSDKQPQRGFAPGSSYELSDIENINMSNGNVMFNIPLASLPADRGGRGGATVRLHYNSKIFDPRPALVPNVSGSGLTLRTFLGSNDNGNWRYGIGYRLEIIDRRTDTNFGYGGGPAESCPDQSASEVIKVRLRLPDGSVRDFRPTGEYNTENYPDFFAVDPEGHRYYCRCLGGACQPSDYFIDAYAPTYENRTYYSSDGTYQKLVISFGAPDVNGLRQRFWTLYMPDGTRVSTEPTLAPNGGNRIIDRNNNYTDILDDTSNGNPATKVVDQLARKIIIEYGPNQDYVRATGVGGDPLVWTIQWKTIHVNKTYYAGDSSVTQNLNTDFRVVDRITLPSQSGGLSYSFDYNGGATNDYPNGGTLNPSIGWGEVSKITLPSGAYATYAYKRDNVSNVDSWWALQNFPTRKDLHYQQEYDSTSTPTTETSTYNYSFIDRKPSAYSSTSTAPDGRTSSTNFINNEGHYNHGLPVSNTLPDGTLIERIWSPNSVPPPSGGIVEMNPYVKTELTSVRNAAGNLIKTAIKDYKYDKNGNVTRVDEYDWIDFSSVERDINGFPKPLSQWQWQGFTAYLKKTTSNSYYNPTPDADDSTTNSGNIYSTLSAPQFRMAIKDTEVSVETQKFARSEFFYDVPSTTGNLTQQKTWDSNKGGYSNPLDSSNSIATFTEYNQFGSPTLRTNARGAKTHFSYGVINGFADLYPTEIKSAYQTPLERTATSQYDFNTGLVTSVSDADNNVTTTTSYDALGRPTLVRAAVGKPEETQIATQYFDAERRIVFRSDLDATGDGKLTSIQHYDQLGRVRLARTLEDLPTTDSLTNETVGLKMQTRYLVSNPCQPDNDSQCLANNSTSLASYVVSSNPYRAGTSGAASSETTMGWTRVKSDRTGRAVEVQTFGGPSLPAPWGSNGASTGSVITAYDGLFTTVTDQANKVRRSETDGLGRLVRVDEPSDSSNTLGSQTSPTQATSYEYDALGNLTQVNQGIQTRIFGYSSLSRLKDATNPESGLISYNYDENGNLATKIDPRLLPNTSTHVATVYQYDALNRVTSRTYNDGTPNVTYAYDAAGVAYSKGKLTSVSSSVAAYSYGEYDALGRVKTTSQTIDGQTYAMAYGYNPAGAMISQVYPSGRAVSTNYDNAGRMAGVKNNATGLYYAGAASADLTNRFQYSSSGAVQAMKLGNGLWEHMNFNSRLQPVQIGLGTASTNSSVLQLDYSYGTSNNNGNIQSQTNSLPGGQTLTQTYSYDQLNRLQSALELNGGNQSWQQAFTYFDQNGQNGRYGNRRIDAANTTPGLVIENPLFDPGTNRIQPQAGEQYAYDLAGDLTRDKTGHTFAYDAENRQTIYDDGNPLTGGATYAYDGDGRRVKKLSSGGTTLFVYNVMGQLVAEYSEALPAGSGTSYLTADNLGTPRVITNSNSGIIGRHDYLPFGEEIAASYGGRSGVTGYAATDDVKQKFTSKERDFETGLDYSQARYYASTQGRFTGVDPLMGSGKPQLPQSWNRYSYCVNNPLVFVDPSGLIWGELNNEAQWFETEEEMKKAGFTAMTQFLRRNPHGEGYLSFDRFQNYYESVSSTAVGAGWAHGETQLRELGFTTKSNVLFLVTDGIPNFVDYLYRTETTQGLIHSPEADFFSVYSGVAGVEYGAARAFSEADSGLSMFGKAFELRQLNKHLPGTAEAAKELAGDGQAFVFNDLSTASRVESEIFARGIQTGSRGGVTRFGLYFDQPIGTQLFKDGGTRALNYGQLKLSDNGLYHIVPRGGPGPQ